MRIFKTKEFDRIALKENLTGLQLRQAVFEIEDGLVDADLGSNLFKKRIAHKNQGKRILKFLLQVRLEGVGIVVLQDFLV